MSEESDSLRTSPSAASLSENELPPAPKPPGYVCSLTEDLVTKAREELQEKPEWRLRDVQALRDMVRKDFPNLRTSLDDAFLLRFLRARKFDYDRALQLLISYHSCRRSWPEVFHNLRPSALKEVLASGFLTVLPHTDPRGCPILCLRPGMAQSCCGVLVHCLSLGCVWPAPLSLSFSVLSPPCVSQGLLMADNKPYSTWLKTTGRI